jgi:hypothetical protein
MMRGEFDVFERFSDGSTLWRATVLGRFEALRKIQELAEHSKNEFFCLNVPAPEPQPQLTANNSRPMAKAATMA